jgi:penicillin-binding protein 2
LAHSCNYYFYTLAERLGIDLLDKWTEKFGLTSSTGIELPGEAIGQVGSGKLLFDPSKPIDKQATSKPMLVMETGQYSIVKLINNFAASRETEYDPELVKEAAEEIVYLLGIKWSPNAVNEVLEDENGVTLGEHVRRILSDKLGISEKISRVQLSADITSVLSELQWSVTKTINTGIGQEITQVTPIAVARYVAAIVNGGTVYQTHIVDKVIGQDGTVLFDKQPQVFGTLDAKQEYLDAIMKGMEGVVDEQEGTAGSYFGDFEYVNNIGGKTGTAQVSQVDLENNSWFVCFAPYSQTDPSVKPEIVVVVYVPNGYKGGLSCYVARDILQYYFDQKNITTEQTIPDVGSLVYESPSATNTDTDDQDGDNEPAESQTAE